MSVKVEVITATDTAFADGQTPIVVLADDDVETISVGEVGPPGPPGQPGPPGIPGKTILYAARDPTPADGNNGDSWINTATNFMFGPKFEHSWPAGISLVGPQGIPGNTVLYGAADPVAATGVDGNGRSPEIHRSRRVSGLRSEHARGVETTDPKTSPGPA